MYVKTVDIKIGEHTVFGGIYGIKEVVEYRGQKFYITDEILEDEPLILVDILIEKKVDDSITDESQKLTIINEIIGGVCEGRTCPEYIVVEKEKVYVFGYANINFGCDIYKSTKAYEDGDMPDEIENPSSGLMSDIAWAKTIIS